MPGNLKASITVLPDGNRVVIPIRAGQSASGLRVEVRGVIRCAYDGHEYDARGLRTQGGADGRALSAKGRPYLAWQPYTPELIEEASDPAAHRYVFRFSAIAQGVSPTLRVDIDRFVDELLIPPSEVRAALSGGFELTVMEPAAAAPGPWRFALASVPALALTGGLAWVIHRRMAAGALDFDLQMQLDRIRRKASAAREAVRPEDARLVPIRVRVSTIEQGAVKLARQVQQLRVARAQHDRMTLERDVELLQKRAASSETGCEEVVDTLREKQKSLGSLAHLEQAEALCSSRLNRIEAILESTLAGLQSVRLGEMSVPLPETVCSALDAEVSALREAGRQMPSDLFVERSRR